MIKFKHIILAAWFATIAVVAQAATVAQLFATAPQAMFPTLDEAMRQTLVQMASADSAHHAQVENRIFGMSDITVLADDYMLINTSTKQQVAMKLLTAGRDSIIAVVTTVRTPVPDSKIAFYDTSWGMVKPKRVMRELPSIASFVRHDLSKKQRKQVLDDIDFAMIHLQFTGDKFDTLTATQMMQKFLGEEQYKPLQANLINTVTWQVDGTKLKANTLR